MAARSLRWLPLVFVMTMGGALGWLAEPALTPEVGQHSDGERNDDGNLSRTDVIAGAWLPLPELEEVIRSASVEDARGLLTKLEPKFWCGHPNGRDALRLVILRLADQQPPDELTRELFRQFAAWELADGVRAEALRNLAAALAAVSGVTPEMIGEALHGLSEQKVRAAGAGFAEERRGESIESDVAELRQLLLAAGLKEEKVNMIAGEVVVGAWFSEQPEAAIAFTLNQPREFSRTVFRPMLRQLYAVDPPAAVAALELMAGKENASYQTGESAFLTGLSAAEFREVWAQIPKDEQINCLEGFAAELALQSPGSVLELTKQFPAKEIFAEQVFKNRHMYGTLLALLPLLVERDADGCRAWLGTLAPEQRVKMLEAAAPSQIFLTPAYTRFCLADPEFQLSSSHAFHLLSAIAGEDLDAALRELPRVPESERLNVEASLRGKSILSRFNGDVAGALQAVGQVPENLRKNVIRDVYATLAEKDSEQLEQWIAANADAPEATALRVYLADHNAFLSDSQREALLAKSLSMIDQYPGVASAADTHVRSLAQTDPAYAAEWFARIPEGEGKAGIAKTLAERWAVTDMAAAVTWAEQLPPSASRDGALLELADKLRSEPEQAFERIVQIGDGEKRFSAAQSFVKEWAVADPERAVAFLAEVPLSEEQKRKLHAVVDASPTRIRQATP